MRWNVRADAERGPGDASARRVRSLPVEAHPAAVGLQHPEQAVEERRLAGAVRADEPDDLTLVDVEADAVERGDTRERLGHVVRNEQGHVAPSVDG